MVYDEGFEIKYSKIKYFAFSKYTPKSHADAVSSCGETLVGWYNNLASNERGCYKAVKVSGHV
jgi:cathepsin C